MRFPFILLMSLALTVSCGGGNKAKDKTKGTATQSGTAQQTERPAIKKYTYRTVNEYPHDTGFYTQGLFWHDGYLYESTGQLGESRLMKVDLATGKPVRQIDLADEHFGEGTTWHNGLIYQLTWQSGRVFVYDGATFERLKTFSFKGEGWGLTSDGKNLYMSNGTDKISVRNPDTFAVERTINVTGAGGRRYTSLNELEWIDGEIWANIYGYGKYEVVRIDPQTGYVTGTIDFSGIQDRAKDFDALRTDVFNGIAHDPDTGRVFVTGKYWNKLYEVEVIAK